MLQAGQNSLPILYIWIAFDPIHIYSLYKNAYVIRLCSNGINIYDPWTNTFIQDILYIIIVKGIGIS